MAVGAVLLIVGIKATHSFADKMSVAFTDRLTQATTWYIIAGAALVLVGLFLAAFGRGRKRE